MPNHEHDDYPRPDFVRTDLNWESLNGPWMFLFDDEDEGLSNHWQRDSLANQATKTDEDDKSRLRTIQVPYVFQSVASGINERAFHEVLWYERLIKDIRTDDQQQADHRLLLRFGAVDYHATVFVDGHYVGEHRGGHVPFEFDITDALSFANTETHRLTVRVFDSATDQTQPRGKQSTVAESKGIFYTPSSGIWQSVWLEVVPRLRIADSSHGTILRSHDIEKGCLDTRVVVLGRRTREACSIEVEASLWNVLVSKSERKNLIKDKDFVRFNQNMKLSEDALDRLPAKEVTEHPLDDTDCLRDRVALWSPEHPSLYEITIRLFDSTNELVDEVNTTTGMRSISWTKGDGTFRLNGREYFQALLLDQGYWPDTIMTPPSQQSLRHDIELSKSMGFNGCRKHQKVEDPAFMYWADKLGFLVWGEMASAFQFSVEYVDRFHQEWMEAVRRDMNHACLVAWTPINESWGYPDLGNNVRQRDHIRSLYWSTKTLDPTRPINDNCGWDHVVTDLSTFHSYKDAPGMRERCRDIGSIVSKGRPMFLRDIYGADGAYDPGSRHVRGAPILCTEFGGVNVAKANSSRKENWGYTTAKDSEDLTKRVENVVKATVESGIVCGVVWTQLTDIEQEQNGLYTYDRQPKLPADRMKAIMKSAKATYYHNRR